MSNDKPWLVYLTKEKEIQKKNWISYNIILKRDKKNLFRGFSGELKNHFDFVEIDRTRTATIKIVMLFFYMNMIITDLELNYYDRDYIVYICSVHMCVRLCFVYVVPVCLENR